MVSRNKPLSTPPKGPPPITRPRLPPKPHVNKRARNVTTGMPPPPPLIHHSVHSHPPRRSWSRRSASWTSEEDAILVQLVKKETAVPPSITASKTWSRVAAQLTNRTGKQCRERYLNQLKPGIRREPWSPEEERILHDTHSRFGNKWVTIANHLPGRTDNCVKNHWNSMMRKRQRRQAALKVAEKQVSATLGRIPRLTTNLTDRNSEGELSVYNGCLTPSGISSVDGLLPSSGIPSPFTASSPITPRRDAKLQISSLVVASSNHLPSWHVPFCTRQVSVLPPVKSEQIIIPPLHSNNHPIPSMKTEPLVSPLHYATDRALHINPSRPSSKASLSSILSTESNTIMGGMSVPSVPSMTNINQGNIASSSPRILRRSSRLIGAVEKRCNKSDDMGRIETVDMQGTKRGAPGMGNALAALAAAASSVPPSPLTPETRFSGISRSRSTSPNVRATAGALHSTLVAPQGDEMYMRRGVAHCTRAAARRHDVHTPYSSNGIREGRKDV